MIGVLSVDDHPLLREGIAALVNAESDMKLVAEASNGSEAVVKFRLHRPDVTLKIGGGSLLSKSISYTTRLTLSYEQRILSLAFSALSYFNPGINRYRFLAVFSLSGDP